MTSHEVKVWSVTPGLLSEGPRWHEERQELLWVDILGRKMHQGTLSHDGALEPVETISVDRHIGAVAPAAGGGYVRAAGQGFLLVDETGSIRELAQPEGGHTDVRVNDGGCDPQGRFWAGTMAYDEAPGAGTLYRLEPDGSCTTVLTGLTISNGIGWSPDASTMYLNDSAPGASTRSGSTGPAARSATVVRSCKSISRAWRPMGSRSTKRAGSGSLYGKAVLSTRTHRTDRFWPACGVRGLPCLPYRGWTPRPFDR